MSTFGKIPGWGMAMGMLHTFVRFVQPKVTIQYPEQRQDISPHHRGRLVLLYDEAGNLKCETCFQCAMACPIEIIDMGGVDTRNRYHVHWGPPEQYAERREESALRRSGRPVPDRSFAAWLPIDLGAARAHPGRPTTTTRADCWPSSSRRRPPTAICRSRRCSTSATPPAPGTARSTASPPAIRTSSSSPAGWPRSACAAARRAASCGGGRDARRARRGAGDRRRRGHARRCGALRVPLSVAAKAVTSRCSRSTASRSRA